METLPLQKKPVNASTPAIEVIFSDFKHCLTARVDPAAAEARLAWIDRFRVFRAAALTRKPLPKSPEHFCEDLRRHGQASDADVATARSAIEEFLAWWRGRSCAAPPATTKVRVCRQEGPCEPPDPSSPPDPPTSLLGRVRAEIRIRHYSYRTEQTYLHWISRYLQFLGLRDPATCVSTGFRSFLEFPALRRHVSAGTQNQAFNALLFLYREVLKIDIG